MKKLLLNLLVIIIVIICVGCSLEEVAMTVDDVVSIPGDFYFIVKDVNTLTILNEDVYMDREVVEIGICDDTENTLCIFIELNENETPKVRNRG